jgi:iron complex outermembrane receptor protein
MKPWLVGSVSAAAMTVMLSPIVAQAQEKSPADTGSQLEELVVTAQRRAEASQKVPISMTVLSAEVVAQNFRTSSEIAQMVPNVNLGSPIGFGTPRTGIRGVSQSDFNPNATTSNMLYFDDVPLNAPVSQGSPIWDLERVEVLRGPQGTLFGRNATGGAIRFMSAMPTDVVKGYAEVGVGVHDMHEVRAAISGPISDTLKGRISLVSHDFGGEIQNVVQNERQGKQRYNGFRGILEWTPNDSLTVVLRAQHLNADQEIFSWKVTPGITNSPGNFGPLANGWTSVGQIQAAYGFKNLGQSSNYYISETDAVPKEHLEHTPISLNVDYNLGFATFTSVTGFLDVSHYLQLDNDASPAPFLGEYTRSFDQQYTQEFRLTSNDDGPLTWIAGAFYMKEFIKLDIDFDATAWRGNQADLFPSARTVGYGRGTRNDLETYAVFLHTTYDITPDLMLTAAARYTSEKKDVTYRFRTQYEFASTAPRTSTEWHDFIRAVRDGDRGRLLGQANPAGLSASDKWGELSWKVGLDYKLSSRAMVYGLISRGFKGGAFSPTNNTIDGVLRPDGSVISVDPETVTDYEVGFKGDVVPGRVRLNGSVFYYDYRNYQTNQLVPQLGVQLLSNLPKARLYGAEVELAVIPVDNLLISVGMGAVKSKITKSSDPSLIGNELPQAEDFNLNVMVKYDFVTEFGTFTPQVSAKYTGNYFTTKENNVPLGGYTIANARIGWESPDEKYYGAVWGTNLFDDVHVLALDDPDEFWGGNNANVSPHRRYGVTFGVRF